MFLPPPGVILGATSVYKCDKGLFARGFCILKCVHRCVQKCVQSVSEWLRVGELRVERKPDSRGPRQQAPSGRREPKVSSPPPGVILGATSVYRCDKGLFARGFCVLKCVQKRVRRCVHMCDLPSATTEVSDGGGPGCTNSRTASARRHSLH
jgi:hypothetical protein